MKKIVLVILAFAFACNTSQKTVSDSNPEATIEINRNPVEFAATITQDELKEQLYVYASDEFEGRETGEPGQKKAVEFIKEQYQTMGVMAAKNDGDYFQKVPLEVGQVPDGILTINDAVFELGKDILTFTAANGNYAEIIYVGYGVEDGNYSDYANLDVNGKIVLAKSGEPKNEDGTYLISGTEENTAWSNMSEALGKKTELANSKGAKGMLYYDSQNYARFKRYFDYMKTNDSGRMTLASTTEENFFILLNEESATVIKEDIETDNTPKTFAANVDFAIKSNNTPVDSENVAALIKGSEKPDEYVVISSHLDHIGVTADGQINNGADDDGSGTVALLEIAEAFKAAAEKGQGPKRSIVFLHVTGEEKGLLGSRFYTDVEPIFPLSQTVANLNIDMIGRIDPKREGDRNYLYIIGSDKLSTDLHLLSEEVNEKYTNIEFDYTYNDENDPNRFYYRSDHYNFAKNSIPIIFYFNGTHADYHKPGDTPDKINYDLLENRTRLIFHTAWEIANRDSKVVVDKAAK